MILIFFAISITVLLGFAGFATDTGMIWVSRSRLQHSVDAAALAAAHELPASDVASRTAAKEVACDFATVENAVPGMFGKTETCTNSKAEVTFLGGGNAIRVTAFRTVQPVFGQALGFQPVEVYARATAQIGSVGSACLFPFFLQTNETENPFTRATIIRGSTIDVGSGTDAIVEAMQIDACADETDLDGQVSLADPVDLQPGASAARLQGWNDRFQNVEDSACPYGDVNAHYRVVNAAGEYELLSTLTPTNCPRLIIMPVLPSPPGGGEYKGNEDNIPIQGFAAFWVEDYCKLSKCPDPDGGEDLLKGDVWGYFVPLSVSSDTYTTYNPAFGTKVVVMTD
jgi:hypothetical protein